MMNNYFQQRFFGGREFKSLARQINSFCHKKFKFTESVQFVRFFVLEPAQKLLVENYLMTLKVEEYLYLDVVASSAEKQGKLVFFFSRSFDLS